MVYGLNPSIEVAYPLGKKYQADYEGDADGCSE